MSSEVSIQIPDQVVSNLIHAEIAESLSNKPELIAAAIREVLELKTSRYSGNTQFGSIVKKMIQAEGALVMKEWIEQNKDMLKKTLMARLNKGKQKQLVNLCDAIINGIAGFSTHVTFKIDEPY